MKYKTEHIEKIYNLYKEGKFTLKELSNKYKMDVSYQFKQHLFPLLGTVHFRNLNRGRFYGTEISYDFTNISNEIEAYILGFIYSDGYITINNRMGIKIIKSDFKHLEKIKNYISPNSNIYTDKNSLCFTIQSEDIFKNLVKWGVKLNKSQKLLKIPKIPKGLIRHFIRGYFDGDGTVYLDGKYLKAGIYSTSKEFLEEIQIIINKNNITSKIYEDKRAGKIGKVPQGYSMNIKNMYKLTPLKRENLFKFYKYLYTDCSFALDRKYLKFIEYFK